MKELKGEDDKREFVVVSTKFKMWANIFPTFPDQTEGPFFLSALVYLKNASQVTFTLKA